MKLPRSNKNNKFSKALVDEIDIDIDSTMKNDNKDKGNEEEEKKTLQIKLKGEKKGREDDENPLDEFRRINSDDKNNDNE